MTYINIHIVFKILYNLSFMFYPYKTLIRQQDREREEETEFQRS